MDCFWNRWPPSGSETSNVMRSGSVVAASRAGSAARRDHGCSQGRPRPGYVRKPTFSHSPPLELPNKRSYLSGGLVRVLGVDPGFATTGVAVVERNGSKLRHVFIGTLRTAVGQPQADRLASLWQGMSTLIAEHSPEVVAIER